MSAHCGRSRAWATWRSSQLAVHLRSSLKAGVRGDELKEIILQVATLAGFPPAMNAMSTLKTVLSESR
ncbi:MAG TPA: carboxymuconolactone decarboxylase family protein [Actinomycetota bacterium]|nr:carboxymuconolactone decarboxylase family protein [Actinomycetota bacterium]